MYSRTTSIYGVSEFRIKNNQLLISKHRFKKQKKNKKEKSEDVPMKNKLQNYFPMIRTQGEVLSELRENTKLWKTFCEWEGKYQQEYLDICTGVKGVKLLYDTYFKAVMNPDTRPERLNDFLSEILGKKVKILKYCQMNLHKLQRKVHC